MTKRFPGIGLVGLVVSLGVCTARPASADLFLTGLTQLGVDASGNYSDDIWNTLGDDGINNLYTIQGSDPNGDFINSGDGPVTRINVSLTGGNYTFTLYGQPGSYAGGRFGLNLFFNENDTTPRISVYAPAGSGFAAYGGSSTRDLAGNFVAGAGTLAFEEGLTRVTLTDYILPEKGQDRVRGKSSSPGDGNDWVGQFTLQVEAVPEAPTWTLFSLGLVVLAVARWRRRKAGRSEG